MQSAERRAQSAECNFLTIYVFFGLYGFIFAFAMAIGEMSATLFIALPQNYTLAVAIYNNLGVRKFVEAGASALILVVICVIAFLTIEKISEGSTGGTL